MTRPGREPIRQFHCRTGQVEENLKKTLKRFSRQALLGIPLYTRLWEETADESGKIKTKTGKALSMQAAVRLMEEQRCCAMG